MSGIIKNAGDYSIQYQQGTVPDVSGAMQDYFQPVTFNQLTKTVTGFQVVESSNNWTFQATIQPFTQRQLMLRPEGERAWTWFLMHAQPSVTLQVDDVVLWGGKQTRVMSRKDFAMYGYVEYSLCQDWTGSGPT
jgi:hypothetical protein